MLVTFHNVTVSIALPDGTDPRAAYNILCDLLGTGIAPSTAPNNVHPGAEPGDVQWETDTFTTDQYGGWVNRDTRHLFPDPDGGERTPFSLGLGNPATLGDMPDHT